LVQVAPQFHEERVDHPPQALLSTETDRRHPGDLVRGKVHRLVREHDHRGPVVLRECQRVGPVGVVDGDIARSQVHHAAVLFQSGGSLLLEAEFVEATFAGIHQLLGALNHVRRGDDLEDGDIAHDGALQVTAERHTVSLFDLQWHEGAVDVAPPLVQADSLGCTHPVDVRAGAGRAGHLHPFDTAEFGVRHSTGRYRQTTALLTKGHGYPVPGERGAARPVLLVLLAGVHQRCSSARMRRAVVRPDSIAPPTQTPFHPLAVYEPAHYSRVDVSGKWCQPSVNCRALVVVQVEAVQRSATQSCPSLSTAFMSGRYWSTTCCTG